MLRTLIAFKSTAKKYEGDPLVIAADDILRVSVIDIMIGGEEKLVEGRVVVEGGTPFRATQLIVRQGTGAGEVAVQEPFKVVGSRLRKAGVKIIGLGDDDEEAKG